MGKEGLSQGPIMWLFWISLASDLSTISGSLKQIGGYYRCETPQVEILGKQNLKPDQ